MDERRAGQSGQELGLLLQPFADDPSTHLEISRPRLREAVVGHVIALDAERVLDHLGGAVAVIAIDGFFEKIGHVTPHSQVTALRGPGHPIRYTVMVRGHWHD